jgi:hypothetical protein
MANKYSMYSTTEMFMGKIMTVVVNTLPNHLAHQRTSVVNLKKPKYKKDFIFMADDRSGVICCS